METRTKIICTLGPASLDSKQIEALIDAGMNVARINFSHGSHKDHAKTVEKLKKAREKKGAPLTILLDTKGPEIRVGNLPEEGLSVKKGDLLKLVSKRNADDEVPVNPPSVLKEIPKNAHVLFDDGYIQGKVQSTDGQEVVVSVLNSGTLKSNKGINVPHVEFSLPVITDQDREDILFGCEQNIDMIAASFVCSASHIMQLKELLANQGHSDIKVIAKIESALGVKNFDSILHASDGIMVARGDLGVELPIHQVPRLQKQFIQKSVQHGKPVIIATQMLESMIQNPRPTRAEVSDVANAIYDGTSAVMLSGETAVGAYPVQTVKLMREVIREAERDFSYRDFFDHLSRHDFYDLSSSVAIASVKTCYGSKAKGIVACTCHGNTARAISRFRPDVPIIAVTPSEKCFHQMGLYWGVSPIFDPVTNVKEAVDVASCYAMKKGVLRYGDLIVITAGTPFGVSGTTNMMIVENIGDVLVRGTPSKGNRIFGAATLIFHPESQSDFHCKGTIAVIPTCSEEFAPLLKNALAIVLANQPEDVESEAAAEKIARENNIPLLKRSDGALDILHEGQQVTLDPKRGLVFKGHVLTDEEMVSKVCSV